MAHDDLHEGTTILTHDDLKMIRNHDDLTVVRGVTRRDFIKCTSGAIVCVSLGSLVTGCGGGSGAQIQGYPINSTVMTTRERMLSFPINPYASGNSTTTPKNPANTGPGLTTTQLHQVDQYQTLGYGGWTFGAPLPVVQRTDIMPAGYSNPTPARNTKFLNFFAFTDIHITDKEAPNQLIWLQQQDPTYSGNNTSIYSPVMMCSTQVLDAAIQTANALHKKAPFDFAISLGDTCNSTSYNETRWYIDVIDGKVITPSSGAHLGAGTIDYQKPYQAAGLDKSIPWYQVLGNHDHFFIGSFPVDADPSLGLRQSYTSDTVWSAADFLIPSLNPATFPTLFNMENMKNTPQFYGGVLDGSTPLGAIIAGGPTGQFATPPKVAADPDRRSLLRTEWMEEFYKTTTGPVGHGFNLVDTTQQSGFACYSFLPKSHVPLKVIVLDDTQIETDGSTDIHGHGYLDANRWAWLQSELIAGQAANQLMIVAAHVPIGVSSIGAETEWWLNDATTTAQNKNAVNLAGLVQTLQNTPNLLMWIAGHRHFNTVKAFVSPDPAKPEQGFWQVETSSLRDFPQQFRTFEIFLNSDYTVSIVTVNVDPAVADGTPAAASRSYAIAAQQIVQNNMMLNNPNIAKAGGVIPVPSMDPTRPQDGTTDPTIKFTDLSASGVPYNASYNAELFKQLSSQMVAVLKAKYPLPA